MGFIPYCMGFIPYCMGFIPYCMGFIPYCMGFILLVIYIICIQERPWREIKKKYVV
jgi:hypothetical protein